MTSSLAKQVTVVDIADATKAFSYPDGLKVLPKFSDLRRRSIDDLLIISNVSQLNEVSSMLSRSHSMEHALRVLLVSDAREHVSFLPNLISSLFHRKVSNVVFPSKGNSFLKRILFAWGIGAQHTLIADAQVLNDELYIFSCAMEILKIHFSEMPALKRIAENQRSHFEIDEQGSYIYWPDADIHLDLDSFRCIKDPKTAEKMRVEALKYDESYGEAIAKVRKERGLRQSDIDGLTERHLSRIETGKMRPSVKVLHSLARAHKLNLDEYLSLVASVVER